MIFNSNSGSNKKYGYLFKHGKLNKKYDYLFRQGQKLIIWFLIQTCAAIKNMVINSNLEIKIKNMIIYLES